MNLSTNLRAAAAQYAAKPALIAGDRVLSYGELDKAAMDLARKFLAEGLVQGDRVAVHGPNTIEVVIAILACHHAGLVVVPVNTRLKPAEIRYVLDHSRPRLCYCDPQFEAGVKAVQPEIPGLTSIYTELPTGVQGADPAAPSSHAPALILYTSGTTARPKGVTHSQRTLMESAQTMFGTGFDESTVTVVTMSMMHTAGLCGSLLPTLLKGGTVVLLPKFDAGELLDLVERWKCTWTLILPSVMQFVAAEQERRPRNLSSMRTWLSGGDSVPVSLQQRWARLCGQSLTEGYGMSESLMISFNPASAIRPGSIGVPAAKVQVRVLDLDGTPVADGS